MDIWLSSEFPKFSLIPDQAAGVCVEHEVLAERELRPGQSDENPDGLPIAPAASGRTHIDVIGPQQLRSVTVQLQVDSLGTLPDELE